jgi:hypothetical protein
MDIFELVLVVFFSIGVAAALIAFSDTLTYRLGDFDDGEWS